MSSTPEKEVKKKTWHERHREENAKRKYCAAVVNSLGVVHRTAKAIGMTPEQEVELLVEVHAVAMEMRNAKDFEKPFCDRAIAAALLRLQKRWEERWESLKSQGGSC